jgi:hypothetical protein
MMVTWTRFLRAWMERQCYYAIMWDRIARGLVSNCRGQKVIAMRSERRSQLKRASGNWFAGLQGEQAISHRTTSECLWD